MLNILAKTTTHPIISQNLISVIGILISIFTVIAVVSYGKRYIDTQNVRGELDAKDSVIGTNKETIDSLKARLSSLESDFKRVEASFRNAKLTIESLRSELQAQIKRYEELQSYTAPEAIKVALSQHKEILSALTYITTLLEGLTHK